MVERKGHLRADDGRSCRRTRREEDYDDRCCLLEGTATGLSVKMRCVEALLRRTKGGTNTKLQAICDSQGRTPNLSVTAGQSMITSPHGRRSAACRRSIGDSAAFEIMFCTIVLSATDRGYDAGWFREALQDKSIRHCIPGRKQRNNIIKKDNVNKSAGIGPRSCLAR